MNDEMVGEFLSPDQLKIVIENILYTPLANITHQLKKPTEKNVPGGKIIVTKAIDRMCLESRFVARAISTLVSPCDYCNEPPMPIVRNEPLTHCVAIAIPSTRIVQSLILSSYSSLIEIRRDFILYPMSRVLPAEILVFPAQGHPMVTRDFEAL